MPKVLDKAELVTEIRIKVLLGSFPAGEVIQENALADEFFVSRTPIREILISLAAEDLIDYTRNQGFKVRNFDFSDIRQFFEAADCIYPQTMALAATNRTEADLVALQDWYDQVCDADDPDRFRARIVGYRALMIGCARASGNRLLGRAMEGLIDRHILIRMSYVRRLRIAAHQDEIITNRMIYGRILDAIRARDTDAVRALVAERLDASRAFLIAQALNPAD